jgi:hypothetical protein
MSIVRRYASAQQQYNQWFRRLVMEKCEQETTITYDLEGQQAHIFSAIRRDQGRLKRAGILPISEDKWGGMSYIVPITRLKWRVTTGKPSRRGFAAGKPIRIVYTLPRKAHD